MSCTSVSAAFSNSSIQVGDQTDQRHGYSFRPKTANLSNRILDFKQMPRSVRVLTLHHPYIQFADNLSPPMKINRESLQPYCYDFLPLAGQWITVEPILAHNPESRHQSTNHDTVRPRMHCQWIRLTAKQRNVLSALFSYHVKIPPWSSELDYSLQVHRPTDTGRPTSQ